jgi:hypothetical protein
MLCIVDPPRGDPIPLKKLQFATQHYSMMNVVSSRARASVDAVAISSKVICVKVKDIQYQQMSRKCKGDRRFLQTHPDIPSFANVFLATSIPPVYVPSGAVCNLTLTCKNTVGSVGEVPHHCQSSLESWSHPHSSQLTISNGCPTITAHSPPTPPATKFLRADVFPFTSSASSFCLSSVVVAMIMMDGVELGKVESRVVIERWLLQCRVLVVVECESRM